MNLKNKRALDCPPSSHTQPLLRPSSLAMAGLLATLFPVLATVPTVSYAFGGGDSSYSTPKTLIQKGEDLFRNETFGGNGRTCATCHRPENNFTIDPKFIATLSDKDPLFVAEFNPNLAQNFEDPELMRKYGLILANTNGFGDLQNKFTMRGVPHTLALNTSLTSSDSTTSSGHNLGFSGDGAPGDGSLRAFATGAVTQHFTKTLNRTLGVDFRLPTDEELDAMEAYQRSLGRQQEIILPLSLKSTVARQGQTIFMDNNRGKCMLCHNNAGANTNFGTGNANFNTGVEAQFDRPAFLDRPGLPIDDGRGHPGDGTFNTRL
jgi:mono/diheme cytochrome c family protein